MVLTGNGNGSVQEGRVQGATKDLSSAARQVRVQVHDGHTSHRPAEAEQGKDANQDSKTWVSELINRRASPVSLQKTMTAQHIRKQPANRSTSPSSSIEIRTNYTCQAEGGKRERGGGERETRHVIQKSSKLTISTRRTGRAHITLAARLTTAYGRRGLPRPRC